MDLIISPDYSPKTLHVALALDDKKDDDRGLVYFPPQIYSKLNSHSERIYENFFNRCSKFGLVPIITEEGPGEFVKTLEEKFKIINTFRIGGIIAPFDATIEQAIAIIEDLKTNPQKYLFSEEKCF